MNRQPSNRPSIPRRTAWAAHLLCAGLAVWTATALPKALAQTAAAGAARSHAIAPGPLAAALNRLGRESGMLISFTPEMVAGLQSPGASGSLTPVQALDALLAGTGLQARPQGDGSMTLQRIPQASAPVPGATLPQVQVTASAPVSSLTEGTGLYAARSTAAATGLALAPRETPQSLEVVTRQRMDDQALRSLADVLRTTTGVSESAYDSERSSFSYRGFSVDNYLYDGVATAFESPYSAGEGELDAILYDRVEVVRGATGLLTGAGNPGGSVNLVRKRAGSRTLTGSVAATLGSWSHYRSDADLSAPLSADGRIRGRIVGSVQRSDTFMERQKKNKSLLYATVEADLTPQTLLRVGMDHQSNRPRASSWGGLPIWFTNGQPIDWKRSTNLAPDWARWQTTTQTQFAVLEHQWDSGWKTHLGYTHSKQSYDAPLAMALGSIDPQTWQSGSGTPYIFRYTGHREQHALDAKTEGSFEWLGREHELVLGATASRQRQFIMGTPAAQSASYEDSMLDWNGSYPEPTWGESYVESDMATRQTGAYAAVRLSLAEPLKVILGSRYSVWDRNTQDRFTQFTPYAGVVLELGHGLSAYASHTDIFQPQSQMDRRGRYLDPVIGKSREIGLKGAFLEQRLQASAAVFDILQDNLAQVDTSATTPDGLDQAYYGAKGARSKGFEAEIAGEIRPGWQAKLGYTRYDIKDAQGTPLSTTLPRNILDLFTTFKPGGPQARLTLGAGLRRQGSIWGLAWGADASGTVLQRRSEQGSYTLVNLMARYEFDERTALQLNIHNAFDRKYLSQVNFYSTKSYGPPRNLLVTLTHKF